jgi:GNAT superfamily N-acetyltransferase
VSAASIRPAQLADAAAMGRLLPALGYEAVDEMTMATRLQRLAEGGPCAVLVAEQQGAVVGWVHAGQILHTASEGFVEVHALLVAQDCQGQGIGRLLLAQVEQWVTKHFGNYRIRLGSGVHRTEAHGFYQHLGYDKRPSFMFWKRMAPQAL